MATAEPPTDRPRDRRASAAEIAAVLGIPNVLVIASSIAQLVILGSSRIHFGDDRLVLLLVEELVFAAVAVPCLYRRGWRLRDMTAPARLLDLARAFFLFVGSLLAYYVIFVSVAIVARSIAESAGSQQFVGRVSVGLVLLISTVNPLFEEFLFLGYGYTALALRLGPWPATGISIALRTAAHAYQGRLAILAILPVAIVFTVYYRRVGRIWPLVLAHAALDFLGMASLADPDA